MLIALQSSLVKWERGTSEVMDTTATVARLEAMCFFMSLEDREPGGKRCGGEGGEGGGGGGGEKGERNGESNSGTERRGLGAPHQL